MSTPYIPTRSHKSLGLAIVLTFLFGPLGLFYASISAGLQMIVFGPIVLAILFFTGLVTKSSILIASSVTVFIFFWFTYWLISMVWAIIKVRSYNREVDEDNRIQMEFMTSLHRSDQTPININIHQKQGDVPTSDQGNIEVTTKPTLQQWLKSNPGKSVNDYYVEVGR